MTFYDIVKLNLNNLFKLDISFLSAIIVIIEFHINEFRSSDAALNQRLSAFVCSGVCNLPFISPLLLVLVTLRWIFWRQNIIFALIGSSSRAEVNAHSMTSCRGPPKFPQICAVLETELELTPRLTSKWVKTKAS